MERAFGGEHREAQDLRPQKEENHLRFGRVMQLRTWHNEAKRGSLGLGITAFSSWACAAGRESRDRETTIIDLSICKRIDVIFSSEPSLTCTIVNC